MIDSELKYIAQYADELYEQGDKETADLLYKLLHQYDCLKKEINKCQR